jgi:hypothetical protein
MRLNSILIATLLLCASCANDATTTPDGGFRDGAPQRDAPVGDSKPTDMVSDNDRRDASHDQQADQCVFGCHWDCFGGHTCENGEIWTLLTWAAPCCNYDDPWPMSGPVCGDLLVTSCPAGETCITGSVDARYKDCVYQASYGNKDYLPGPATTEFLRLLCSGSQPKKAGDSCTSDSDCRPAAASVTSALACDTASKQCALAPRPSAPAGYMQPCVPSGQTPFSELVYELPSKELCHATGPASAGGCVKQGLTLPCVFDEDCPTGSICLCGKRAQGGRLRFCAAATDRTTPAGRTAGLSCPPSP